MRLTEDEIYRSSTQFRLWSFTPEALASLRKNTNETAAERVKANVRRIRDSRLKEGNGTSNGNSTPTASEKEVDCLTVDEEQKIVSYYCRVLVTLGNVFKHPIQVIVGGRFLSALSQEDLNAFSDARSLMQATGVQYMKRFYLFNSPMTYHPKEITRCALFLAGKTENRLIPVRDFAAGIPKTVTTPEEVLAPEFLLTQALRFTFDVRHPFRALAGGNMELHALAHGVSAAPPTAGRSQKQLQEEMLELPRKVGQTGIKQSLAQMELRLATAQGEANRILKTHAILTDAYFHYTPSQIFFAAYLLADEPLTLWYMGTKFPADSDSVTEVSADTDAVAKAGALKAKVIATVRACAALIDKAAKESLEGSAGGAPQDEGARVAAQKKRDELILIDKKLHECRDPDKMDLIALNKAQKRGVASSAATEGSKVEESASKRRKMIEKEGSELLGPEIKKE